MKDNRYHTLNQWNEMGYLIIKGQKSHHVNKNGVHEFSPKQVIRIRFQTLKPKTRHKYNTNEIYFGENGNPDPMDYDLGLCGQT